MAKDPSVGAIVGFAILIAAVVIFVIGVTIYGICVQCLRKPKKDVDKSKPKKRPVSKASSHSNHQSAVIEEPQQLCAGDVEWHNPLVELESVLEEEDKKIEEASQLGSELQTNDSGYQNGTLERQQPEILEEEPDYQRNSMLYNKTDDVEQPSTSVEVIPEPKRVSSLKIEIEHSPEPSLPSDTLERREAKDLTRSNSILDRVSYFESAQNSLVRPARGGKELEGVRSRVVTGLVSNFEKSDKVLLGRQAPEAGDIHIMQSANNENDPVYAVPDRNRKSDKRKSRPESHMSEDSEKSLPTPQVPTKPEDL